MTHDARILDFNHRHLGGRMDHRAALILAASLLCGSAHAGYAQLAAPEGWSAGGGAATFRYPSAANAATFSNGTVLTNASLNVGGKAVQVPASMRIAANAGRIAAAAIYLHPALRTAAVVASWVGAAGLAYDVAKGWQRPENATVSDGYSYYASDRMSAGAAATPEAAAQFWVTYQNQLNGNLYRSELSGSCEPFGSSSQTRCPFTDTDLKTGYSYVRYAAVKRSSVCPAGWFHTPGGCVQNPPMRDVSKEEFERLVPDARPMPPGLPGVVWPASWPVEVPEIQPMFIPTGNPVPNPKYDPSAPPSPSNHPWLQPGVKLSPAPTPNAPWQVDLQPVNRPTDSPTPKPDPVQEPVPNPDGSGNNDKPRDPEKDERDFCEKNPDVLACQKLDEPEDPGKLKVQEVDFNFQPESGFAGSATCPSPITVSLSGRVFSISWQPFCNSLNMIKPFLLAMAWLSAAFIMLGARKE